MRFTAFGLTLALAVFATGCTLPGAYRGADTALEIRPTPAADPTPLGFQRTDYVPYADRFVILGRGRLPVEHESRVTGETHAGSDEVHPADDRLLRVTCNEPLDPEAPQSCRIELLLPRGWPNHDSGAGHDAYAGIAVLQFKLKGQMLSTNLHNVRLAAPGNPSDVVYISGAFVGQYRVHEREHIQDRLAWFDRYWTRATTR